MEGVAYSLYGCLSLIREGGIEPCEMALCGGGAKSDCWRSMLTDLYGLPTSVRESTEGAALGAAILGGCAAGVYSSVEDGCRRAVRNRSESTPNGENHAAYLRCYRFYDALYPAMKESFAQLKEI